MSGGGDAPRQRAHGIVAIAFALPVVLRALSYTDRILDRDETYWMASAMRMRAADLPVYVAGWDTKPPLPFLFHRLALALSPDAPLLAAHVLAGLLAGAAGALVAAAALRLGGRGAALVAAALFALLDSTGPVRALAANTEVLTYVPVALLTWAIAAGRPRGLGLPFAVGACAAVAFLAKHPAAIYAPAGFAALLLCERERGSALRQAAAGLAGTAAVLAVAFGWIAAAGAWDDFVACNVTISGHRARNAGELAKTFGYGRWAAVAVANPVAIAGVVAALVRGASGAARPSARRAALVAGPLAAGGLVAAVAGGAAFQHYLQLAWVPVAVLAGCGLADAPSFATRRFSPAAWTALVVAAAAGAALPDRIGQWRSRDWPGYDTGPVPALRERVRALVAPSETMFVWGIHPDLYVTCGRAPASRFVTTNWLVGTYTGLPPTPDAEPFEFVPGSWDLLFADLGSSRPALVVDSVPAGVHGFVAYPMSRFPRLAQWVESRYVREEGPGGYVLWRRR
jgi:4-amino-4-deoxy-L-arabinose transferase-like glycosyltransferase